MELKIHALTWDKICRSLSKGGLGISRLADINTASGLKLFGRFVNSESLWAFYMRETYLRGSSFYLGSASVTVSGTSKFCSSGDVAEPHLHFFLDDGKQQV